MSYVWPELDNDYDTTVHAIGRITALWNSIENLYDEYLAYCSGGGFASFQFLSSKLNNSQKIALITYNLNKHPKKYEPVTIPIEYFLKCAQICGANRNFFIHAYVWHDSDSLYFTKKSQSKVGATNILNPSLNGLRKIANEIAETLDYGEDVLALFKRNQRHLLPQTFPFEKLPSKPAQPKNWDSHPSRYTHQER